MRIGLWSSLSTRKFGHARYLHGTAIRSAVTKLQMPAMSPTMTEGGIAQWKKKEGEAYSAGDVLLEIETDKASIDVEAQDDGIMGKILVPDGTKNVVVGKTIALLAEEGDDISNLAVPEDEPAQRTPSPPPPIKAESQSSHTPASSPSSSPAGRGATPQPEPHSHVPTTHSRPLFPSVHRLLLQHDVPNPDAIVGTGVRGMLTRGDVLAYLGKASSPTGTYQTPKKDEFVSVKAEPKVQLLDGPTLRRLILTNLSQVSATSRLRQSEFLSLTHAQRSDSSHVAPIAPAAPPTFDSILADYLPPPKSTPVSTTSPLSPKAEIKDSTAAYFEGLTDV